VSRGCALNVSSSAPRATISRGDAAVPASARDGSFLTRRWRKTDSKSRSPVSGESTQRPLTPLQPSSSVGVDGHRRHQACQNEVAIDLRQRSVGTIVALTYASAIDDPARFRSSKSVGAHFGLTPKKYQSGETDVTGRISKIGDGGVRTALYEAANVILTRPVKGSALKSWGMRLAARTGMRKAKVALARKLAVVLHRMRADGTIFLADKAAVATTH
jgi:transposase IS116/IS110/IS902 family protein